MGLFFNIAIPLALMVVLATLFMGFYAMMRGGDYARLNSNRFMRYRVITQAVAIGVVALGILYKGVAH
jgi:hypothetical protein